MTGEQLKLGRELKEWSQEQAALRLGVSQPYLSLLERGGRRVPERLARKAAGVYGLSAATLPLKAVRDILPPPDEDVVAADLSSLGYPGLSHLRGGHRSKNPAEVLLSALNASDLDSRLIEALPWVLVRFPEVDWLWLVAAAKLHDLQNRLGFITAVARRLAEVKGEREAAALLARRESELFRSRLAREDTLCHDSLTATERRWLRSHRTPEAKRWNLLTDLSEEHLSYAA